MAQYVRLEREPRDQIIPRGVPWNTEVSWLSAGFQTFPPLDEIHNDSESVQERWRPSVEWELVEEGGKPSGLCFLVGWAV